MKTVNIPIKVRVWKDKQTKTFLVSSKKYDVTGYGKTRKRALRMFEFSVKEILTHTKTR